MRELCRRSPDALPGCNGLEEARSNIAVGHRLYVARRFLESGVSGPVERRALAARALAPGGELLRGHRQDVKLHAGEAVAAEVRRTAGKNALPVRLQVQA